MKTVSVIRFLISWVGVFFSMMAMMQNYYDGNTFGMFIFMFLVILHAYFMYDSANSWFWWRNFERRGKNGHSS